MTRYIWQGADWPNLNCDLTRLATTLAAVRHRQGQLLGRMQALGFSLRDEAWLQTLTQDVVRTSEIEGERLDVVQVRSSLARRLGIEIGGLAPVDRHVEGIVEILVNATQRFAEPLTTKRLFNWHGALFPTGRSGLKQIRVAAWRDDAEEPMQVVSGALGREKLHFIAPPATKLESEMTRFLSWYEQEDGTDLVVKAGLAHLWFITLHPFDDGNGRIARALSDMALARSEQTSQRFYSLSAQMQHERSEYYQTLERTQKGELTVIEWMSWFLDCLQRALERSEETLSRVLTKAKYWDRLRGVPMNARQIKVLNRLLDGFDGKLTTSKWAKLAKCSQDTAHRDILALMQFDALAKAEGGGRSTHYELVFEEIDWLC